MIEGLIALAGALAGGVVFGICWLLGGAIFVFRNHLWQEPGTLFLFLACWAVAGVGLLWTDAEKGIRVATTAAGMLITTIAFRQAWPGTAKAVDHTRQYLDGKALEEAQKRTLEAPSEVRCDRIYAPDFFRTDAVTRERVAVLWYEERGGRIVCFDRSGFDPKWGTALRPVDEAVARRILEQDPTPFPRPARPSAAPPEPAAPPAAAPPAPTAPVASEPEPVPEPVPVTEMTAPGVRIVVNPSPSAPAAPDWPAAPRQRLELGELETLDVEEGTDLVVATTAAMVVADGQARRVPFEAVLIRDLELGGRRLLPAGSRCLGHLCRVEIGRQGRAQAPLELTAVQIGDRLVAVDAWAFRIELGPRMAGLVVPAGSRLRFTLRRPLPVTLPSRWR
jgi:hypothetical protein